MAADDATVDTIRTEQLPRGQLRWLWVTVAVIALDQFTKYLVKTHIGLHESIDLLPVFSLTHWLNPGAAFNFLAGQAGWQRWFFALLAAGVSVALIVWLRRLPRSAQITGAALALILGGALGNLIDRVSSGLVVDFLLVHWHEHYFPAFNVADSAITVGAALLLIDAYLGQKTDGRKA